jgi:hypothetical protein
MRKIHSINFTNKWLIVFLISLSGPAFLYAQDKIIQLVPPKQPISTRFSRVIIMDHRADTTNIGVSNTGYPIRFNTIASLYIKRYINRSIHPGGNSTVLIYLKKLAFNRDHPWQRLLLSTDVYLQKNDSLWTLIASVDKSYKFRKSFAGGISQVLKALIDTIDYGLGSGRANDSPSFSLQQINSSSLAANSNYPILNPERSPSPGYYPNFLKFRADSIIHSDYGLEYQKDSAYHLISPSFPDDMAYALLNNIWVLSDKEGGMYIHLTKDIFLPLIKKDNTFCFYIPHSLPDMRSIQMLEERNKSLNRKPDSNDFSFPATSNSNNLLVIPVTIAMILVFDLALHSTATLVTHSQIKKINASGRKSEKFRDCFIDMNSGYIVYY